MVERRRKTTNRRKRIGPRSHQEALEDNLEKVMKKKFDKTTKGFFEMHKLIVTVFIFVFLLFVGAIASPFFFGEKVEVPIAHYGKIRTKEGMLPGIKSPSKFRLPKCFVYCDELMLVEASDFAIKETFREDHALYMPKSQLTMPFDVRGTFAIKNNESVLDAVFDRLPAENVETTRHKTITAKRIYETYGRPIVRDVVRRILANYSIEEVASSRAQINQSLNAELLKAFSQTPILVRRFGLGDVRFPKVILDQKETSARRKIAIEQEEAEKQIRLVKLQADLEAARAERAIRREKAEAAKEENLIAAESVTEKYLQYKNLEVLGKLAENPNTVWVPFGMLDQAGVSVAVKQGLRGK